ncbi:hypothetical protein C2U68_14075 [Methylomonas koyamae]|nr:hypothetical protein C2U68_14075 [Methylomonas koyamae]
MNEKRISEDQVLSKLGYRPLNTNPNGFSRFIKGQSAIGLNGLLELEDLLDVDMQDIVKKEYAEKFSSFKLKHFEDECNLNAFLFDYEERHGGRYAVLNSFPSMIYYPNDDPNRKKRFDLLNKNGIDNKEYYPLRAILEFAFGNFSKFSKNRK